MNAINPADLSGLELMQLMIKGHLPPPPIANLLGFYLSDVALMRAEFEGTPTVDHTNPMGVIHGGWYGAILDSVMTCAVQTAMKPGQACTTLEFKINVTRPIPPGTKVRAIGQASHVGRSTGVADAKLIGVDDGKLYATGSTTCIVMNVA